MMRSRKNSEEGIVLIAVIFATLAILSLSLAIASTTHTALLETRTHRESLQAEYLARGAIVRVATLLAQPRSYKTASNLEPSNLIPSRMTFDDLGAPVTVEIAAENGKIDLNSASEETFRKLFEALGSDLYKADVLAKSLVLARQPVSNANSVELSRGPSKTGEAWNSLSSGEFTSIEQLMGIQGISADMFYGRYEKDADGHIIRTPGLVDCVTVYTHATAVNINFANGVVLRAITRLPVSTIDSIQSERRQKLFASVDEISRRLPVLLDGDALSVLTANPTNQYSLIATASMPSGVRRRIRAVVEISSDGSFRVMRWEEFYVD